MLDLTEVEIISQLRARIKELEDISYRNAQSSLNVVKYFSNRNL